MIIPLCSFYLEIGKHFKIWTFTDVEMEDELEHELLSEAETAWAQREWSIQHVLFPSMRLFLKPPTSMATNGTFVQVRIQGPDSMPFSFYFCFWFSVSFQMELARWPGFDFLFLFRKGNLWLLVAVARPVVSDTINSGQMLVFVGITSAGGGGGRVEG